MKFLNGLEFGPPTVTQIPHWVPLDDLSFRACSHGPTSNGAARAAAGAHSVLDPARLPADVGVTNLLELPLGGSPSKPPERSSSRLFSLESQASREARNIKRSPSKYTLQMLFRLAGNHSRCRGLWRRVAIGARGGGRITTIAPERTAGRGPAGSEDAHQPVSHPSGSRRGRECWWHFRNRLAEILFVCETALQPCASGAAAIVRAA